MSVTPPIDPAMQRFGHELIQEAGRMVREPLASAQARVKGPFDLITEVDTAVESHVRKRLDAAYPDHALLGEESVDATSPVDVSGYCWVLDPLDGTVNFAFDLPFYAVSLALLHAGEPVMGWVLDPLRDELFSARAGEAPLLNGEVMTPPEMRTALPVGISTGLLSHWASEPGGPAAMEAVIGRYGKLRLLGSQALQLCYVAAGRLAGAINLEAKLWDDAAGALIVRAGGGRYTDVRGASVFPVTSEGALVRGSPVRSLAGDPQTHADLLEVLNPPQRS